jgi:HD superfamily phosphohydrolase YqeK
MLVFISDYIEEERDFVSYDLKVLAKENLLKTTLKIMIETKKYLELNMRKVAKITLDAIVYYQNKLEELNDR